MIIKSEEEDPRTFLSYNASSSSSSYLLDHAKEEQLEYSDDDDDNDDDTSTTHFGSAEKTTTVGGVTSVEKLVTVIPSATRGALKIDELDDYSDEKLYKRSPPSCKRHRKKSAAITTTSPSRTGDSIQPKDLLVITRESEDSAYDESSSKDKQVIPCPCCKSYVRCKAQHKRSNLIASGRSRNRSKSNENTTKESDRYTFSSLMESLWPSTGTPTCQGIGGHDSTDAEEDDERTEISSESTSLRGNHYNKCSNSSNSINTEFQYTVTKCLKESWLHKKGSGNDVFGSKSWKARWCQLVLAEIPGYHGQVPLLLASWHSSLPKPSTIIVLEEKIAIPVDALHPNNDGKDAEFTYKFDIVSEIHQGGLVSSCTRTFSAVNIDVRDDWVQNINDSICNYGRFKKSLALKNVTSSLPPMSPRSKSYRSTDKSDLEGLDLVY